MTQFGRAIYWQHGAWMDMLLGNRDRSVAGFTASALAYAGWWHSLWK